MGRQFALHTPLTVADKFGEQLNNKEAAWIFTSATLEVGGTLIISVSDLVLRKQNRNSSQPFDYPNQSLLCVPRYLPTTNQNNTLQALW